MPSQPDSQQNKDTIPFIIRRGRKIRRRRTNCWCNAYIRRTSKGIVHVKGHWRGRDRQSLDPIVERALMVLAASDHNENRAAVLTKEFVDVINAMQERISTPHHPLGRDLDGAIRKIVVAWLPSVTKSLSDQDLREVGLSRASPQPEKSR